MSHPRLIPLALLASQLCKPVFIFCFLWDTPSRGIKLIISCNKSLLLSLRYFRNVTDSIAFCTFQISDNIVQMKNKCLWLEKKIHCWSSFSTALGKFGTIFLTIKASQSIPNSEQQLLKDSSVVSLYYCIAEVFQ